MSASIIFLASLTIGIDAGWQPGPEGGVEYTLQIDARSLELLKSGRTLFSDVMPNLRDIRQIRLTSKEEQLARLDPPAKTEQLVAKPPVDPNAASVVHTTRLTSDADGPPGESEKMGFLNWPLGPTAIGLFASLGANLFLGWTVAGAYRKNRQLARKLAQA